MKKLGLFLCTLVLVFGVAMGASAATITNGSFELGFTGWDTIGDVSVQNSSFGSGPTDGVAQMLIETGPASVDDAALESFLGLVPGMLDAMGTSDVTQGSAIKQDITVQAGEILTFDWNFLTDDFFPWNDFAFYSIAPAAIGLADTLDPLVLSATSFPVETGFNNMLFMFPTAGTYTLGFGVVDVFDDLETSGLLVDNINVVPLPPAILLLGSGLAGLAILRRRGVHRT